jgi:CysZ protein
MSPLSEKIENYVKGDAVSAGGFQLTRAIKEMIRGIRISVRNIIREILYTLLLLCAGLIPLVGLFSSIAIFGIQAYYAGFGNLDYTLERHYGVRESAEFVRDYRGLAVANGTVFLLLLMIPFIGLFLAPSLATISGALETVERLEQEI